MSTAAALSHDPVLSALRHGRAFAEATTAQDLFERFADALCDLTGCSAVGLRDGDAWAFRRGDPTFTSEVVLFGPAGEGLTVVSNSVWDDVLGPWVAELAAAAEAVWGGIGNYSMLEDLVAHEMATVVRREASIQLILDSMSDGLVVCDRHGALTEIRSAATVAWFGEPAPDQTLWHYLHPHDEAAADQLEIGFEQLVDGFLPFEVAAAQIAGRFRHEGHWYGLSFEPVHEGEELTGLVAVVALHDHLVAAERAEADSRELVAIVQQVMADPGEARASIGELRRLVDGLDPDRRLAVLRDLHTLKGGSAVIGLQRLAKAAHHAEDAMAMGTEVAKAIAPVITEAAATFARIQPLLGATDTLQVSRQSVDEVLAHISDRPEVGAIVRSWRHTSMTSLFRQLTHRLDEVATTEGKQVQVRVQATHLHAPSPGIERFLRTLSHVTRNAVAHGIETVAQREALGKDPTGTVRLGCWLCGPTFSIRIADDGAGIDWTALQALAEDRGVAVDGQDDLVRFLLGAGVSTRQQVDELAGRGQGMAAVVHDLDALGGTMEVESHEGIGTTWTFHLPVDLDA